MYLLAMLFIIVSIAKRIWNALQIWKGAFKTCKDAELQNHSKFETEVIDCMEEDRTEIRREKGRR